MRQTDQLRTWLFVVHETLHLSELKQGEESWWCVDRSCIPGELAFIYRPLRGISLLLEILAVGIKSEIFCSSYGMATARIRLLRIFDPPIHAKRLKSSEVMKAEPFIRQNFQGKAFILTSEETKNAIIGLAKPEKS